MALLFLVSRWACFFLPPQLLVFSLHSPQGAALWANNMLLPDSYLKMSYPMLFCLQNMIFFFYLFLQEVKNLMTNNSNTSWSTRAQANWMQIFFNATYLLSVWTMPWPVCSYFQLNTAFHWQTASGGKSFCMAHHHSYKEEKRPTEAKRSEMFPPKKQITFRKPQQSTQLCIYLYPDLKKKKKNLSSINR